MGEQQVEELKEGGLGAGGAGPAGGECGADLAGELARLPEVAGVVDPVLELAGDAAPVGRAEDEGVAVLEIVDCRLVQAAVAQRHLRNGANAFGYRLGEMLGEAAAGVEEEEDGGHGNRIVAEDADTPKRSGGSGSGVVRAFKG